MVHYTMWNFHIPIKTGSDVMSQERAIVQIKNYFKLVFFQKSKDKNINILCVYLCHWWQIVDDVWLTWWCSRLRHVKLCPASPVWIVEDLVWSLFFFVICDVHRARFSSSLMWFKCLVSSVACVSWLSIIGCPFYFL